MKRLVEVGSVFGRPQRTSYEYMKKLKIYNKNKVLIVDDKDGLHSIPFAYYGFEVVMYEPNKVYLDGGIIDNYNLTPITNRKHYKNTNNNIKIENNNFYKLRVDNKYDFVFCYRSLHEKHNKTIPMKRKIRKLQSSVKEGGYIYIFYHMAKNERDIANYPRNQYFRKNEMKTYFDSKNWKIILLIENSYITEHKGHPFNKKNHGHMVGYIFAQKKNNRLVHKTYYEIIGLTIEQKRKNELTRRNIF